MKKILFVMVFCAVHLCYGQPARNLVINPTGTYILKGEKHKREIRGNYGEVRAKLLNESSLAIAMYVNSGYPHYISASFTDTIFYSDNRAVYRPQHDTSCHLMFAFDTDGLNIKQIYTDPASTCGFGKGVMPLGFIAKHSSEVPIIQPLSYGK